MEPFYGGGEGAAQESWCHQSTPVYAPTTLLAARGFLVDGGSDSSPVWVAHSELLPKLGSTALTYLSRTMLEWRCD